MLSRVISSVPNVNFPKSSGWPKTYPYPAISPP